MSLHGLAVVAAFVLQSPAGDSLYALVAQLSEPALTAEARSRPLVLREALGVAMRGVVRAPTAAARDEQLGIAHRLAAAHAAAWEDSFLVREVSRFSRWPPERRAAKLAADSVRRAGVEAFARRGAAAAIAIWRRALARSAAIGDTAGVASVLGNIGAGFLRDGQLDSAAVSLERARALAARVGDLRVEANAVVALADLSAERGDANVALRQYTRALALHQRVGDTRGEAADYNNLGLLAQESGDLEEARRQFDAALAINRRNGDDALAATNLVNLAGLASLAGDYSGATARYREALAVWRAREMWAESADALRGLGQVAARRGDYPAAHTALEEARAIFDRTGPPADALAVRRELAGVLSAMGRLQQAVALLGDAQRFADSADIPAGARAPVALARAELALQLNTLAEAERLYGLAARLFRDSGDRVGEAEAQDGLGRVFLSREDFGRAGDMFRAALRTQLATGDRRAAALTRMSVGQLARARGDTATARRELRLATMDLTRIGDAVGTAVALGERAALEVDVGAPAKAESLYRAGLARVRDRATPEVSWSLRSGLGLALRARGAVDEAVRELRAAAADLERASHSLALPERRSAFRADKWDVYAQLALTEHARGRAGAAFEASERLRGREMLELLARGRISSPTDTAAELAAREEDLRRRIGELTRALAVEPTRREPVRGPDVGRIAGATREALLAAQEAYAALTLEIREQAPAHATVVAPEPATWRSVAARLRRNEAFVEYLVSDTTTLAFVVARDTVAAIDLGVGRRGLARLIEFVRGTMEPRSTARLDSLWRSPMRRLYGQLVAPLEERRLLEGISRIVLVPHAELHYLPFAALVGGSGRFLIERYELTVTPSASVWMALGERRRGGMSNGIFALAPKPQALPASGKEVAALRRLGGARVLMGSAATEEEFRRRAPGHRVLHLATYGLLNQQNPLFSFVELGASAAHDGRLEVHEVFGLRLTPDLVVLSACQTAVGSGQLADVPAGDDWVSLTRAFLHAGAGQVAATLWPVEDWPTAALMERFYEEYLNGDDAPRALARAQRALLAVPGTAHPYFWAGFVLSGSGRQS